MIKVPVRDLHCFQRTPTRIFDVIVENERIELEVKTDRNKYKRILWDDVVYQVEAARKSQLKK